MATTAKPEVIADMSAADRLALLQKLRDNYITALGRYVPIFRRIQLIDAIDRGKLWEALGGKFPAYQILPDTNHVAYIKSNLVASIYSVTKGANILSTSESDREAIANLNVALEFLWDKNNIGHAQLEAGENAALHNLGITEVGWDVGAKYRAANGTPAVGNVVVRNVHPLQFMRDPFAKNLESSAYCLTWDDLHKNVLLQNPVYKEPFEAWAADNDARSKASGDLREGQILPTPDIPYDTMLMFTDRPNPSAQQGYVRLYRHFFKDIDDKGNPVLVECHTVNNEAILYYRKGIKPNIYPFAECFCNLPNGDVIGQSECQKIMRNSVAYNVLNSLLLTSEYRNQRPPKFVNSESGLNLATFTKYGNDPDYTFLVRGDATRAVHYHEYPQPSQAAMPLMGVLGGDMQLTSGIDERYTGRDTGSILTTGGVEDMLSRVTLTDSVKIKNYETYTVQLSQLILANLIEFGGERDYVTTDPATQEVKTFQVNFKDLQDSGFLSYAVNISSELPKNKQRLAAWANMVLEKQAQYAGNAQGGPEWITPEEWLEFQDPPNKERMLARMKVQRLQDTQNKIANIVYSYGTMVSAGLDPAEAIQRTAANEDAMGLGGEVPYPVPEPEDLEMLNGAAQDAALSDEVDPMAIIMEAVAAEQNPLGGMPQDIVPEPEALTNEQALQEELLQL